MQTTEEKHTYEDYAALPEGAPYELIDGTLVMTPSPTPYHQIVQSNLEFVLQQFVRSHRVGLVLSAPIDVYLSDTDTFQPDLIYIAEERLGIIGEQKIEAAPDLVMEVLSPSTGYYDLTKKKHTCETAGVEEYWIVDPNMKTAEIHANTAEGFTASAQAREQGRVASKLLDGFSIDLDDLF